ncbi:hypothetical protein BDR07DRAFT_1270602 [Suillus spraguei]|nr:hypothetical protein BDR07DRAFT_1270602 [Suillus spraguei]
MEHDVWTPKITSPTSASTWTVGGMFLVTWDMFSKPPQMSNPIGEIYLHQEDWTGKNPIASRFELSSGQTKVTVPDDTIPGGLMVNSVMGDSGNTREEFPIVAAT